MTRGHRRLDEDDVRSRPRPTSRPRSKLRPDYPTSQPAMVIMVDRGRITCAPDADPQRQIVAVKARELGRKAAVVGDRVWLHGDLSGTANSLARLVAIAPRRHEFRRTADDRDPAERVIVANAGQLGIVVAAAEPEPRAGLIDRCLVAAFDAGVEPFLAITKPDLACTADLIEMCQVLAVPSFVVWRGSDLAALRRQLSGQVTVLIGHSGVGKSTLVNALVPDADRDTGAVNTVTGRGRHTSTSVRALPLPGSGWIIDTPGVRSFGLAHVDRDRVVRAFAELSAGIDNCPRGCRHVDAHCALDSWVAAGQADPQRLQSLRRILLALDEGTD